MRRTIFAIGIFFLFVISTIVPVVFNNVKATNKVSIVENYNFDRYLYPEYYDCYNVDEIPDYVPNYSSRESSNTYKAQSEEINNPEKPIQQLEGPMDSPWPMYCHDVRHTGRSPYSTSDNSGILKWQYECGWSVEGSGAIDNDGVIYFGSRDGYFNSLYQNGTLKWRYYIGKGMECGPALDKDGTIYFGTRYSTSGNYLYAMNPNGTLKWKYETGDIFSSPAIGDDGTIYFGCQHLNPDFGSIYALYPNGTLRWEYRTDDVVYSSPAIDPNGTIYCGSHDTYLYALYPINGTLKWKYKTGNWIRTSPCIGDDGTIYVVSLDDHLHAVNPDGTQKWVTDMGEGGTSPTIGQDGTIYAGYRTLHAINPVNGSIKWTFDVSGTMRGGTPCNSIDGTIYFGTIDGGELIAVNPDGTEKWRKSIGTVEFAPIIAKDGTVYIGTSYDNSGYLFAFGKLDPNAPTAPQINGQTSGTVGKEYEYTFKSTSPLGRDVYYYIEWGDGTIKDWFGPYASGEEVTASYSWSNTGTYTIKARAKDTDNLWGPWGELTIKMPRVKSKSVNFNSLFLNLLEQFPLLQKLLFFIF